MTPAKSLLEKHYEDLAGKPFYPGLVAYMASGPVCAMVWEGKDVVKQGRAMLGATNPLASAPGTIRGDFGIVSWRIPMPLTLCHTAKCPSFLDLRTALLHQYRREDH